ncbi:MAG TPA: uroporphyrinogen-III synthase [Acidimicrobiales bacterium]|nr:uroporphyrinogen-III synthase [Acidimicrobiales bacterium]
MALGPLEGFTVAVTADRRWKEQAELLTRRGATVVHAPTMRTDYLTDEQAVREATVGVIARPPDFFVATTGIGVRAWFEAAQSWGLGEDLLRALDGARVVARGPKAAAVLQANGVEHVVRVAGERMEEVLGVVLDGLRPGDVVAVQQYGTDDPVARAALEQAGAAVVEVPVYRWRAPEDRSPAERLVGAVCAGQVDAVTFTSAPSVRNLVSVAEELGREDEMLAALNGGQVVVACVGPVCAEGARQAGVASPVAPEVGRLGLLIRVLTDALAARRRQVPADGGGGPVTIQGAAVERGSDVVRLSFRERMVLEALVDAAGGVVPKAALLRIIGRASSDPHAVEVVMARLRRRLATVGLGAVAVPKRGYRLVVTPPTVLT